MEKKNQSFKLTTKVSVPPVCSQVLSCILDPLLQLCTVSASNLGTADMASYMVNSLYVMKTTLALFEFTDKRLEMLEFQVGGGLGGRVIRKANDKVCSFPGAC